MRTTTLVSVIHLPGIPTSYRKHCTIRRCSFHFRSLSIASCFVISGTYVFFSQRALAALAAIWERFCGASFAALAAPPLSPPRRPSATACGFFDGSTGFSSVPGSYFGASPMDSRNIWWASAFGSRGRLLERSDMADSTLRRHGLRCQDEIKKFWFKLTHYHFKEASLSMTLLRPPPSLRTPPEANAVGSFRSAIPWRITDREIPVALATTEIPPLPTAWLSAAANNRRERSSRSVFRAS